MIRLLLALVGIVVFFWLFCRNRRTAREVAPWLNAKAIPNEHPVDRDKRLRAMEAVLAQAERRKTPAMAVAVFGSLLSVLPLVSAVFSWESWILLGVLLGNCLMWLLARDWGRHMLKAASGLPEEDQKEIYRLLEYRVVRDNFRRSV